jgi:hypothetical protein
MVVGCASEDGDRVDNVTEDSSAWGEDVRDSERSCCDIDLLLRALGVSASAMISICWYT